MKQRSATACLVLAAKKLAPLEVLFAQLMLLGIWVGSSGLAFGFSSSFSKFQQQLVLSGAFATAVVCAVSTVLIFVGERVQASSERQNGATDGDSLSN